MTLEEALAEWAVESLVMANEMWHHGAIDTAVADGATPEKPEP
ncbi:hypothetical protein PP639_gp037 [Arthrobacter phage Seahorse]|uniref:Uncharacterized protein n=1 Tax=Arthrobacter phage Seahorse TaxID=2419611 RepID=A0A3G3M618_9CAUD|nr:hypothetical protein PP639_gp037 [Arthrobacter phage Seahorse]AYR01537.1 hypothetical protein PBI_SEAHORSE_37 [Arthrobacter phage Seahorse]